MSHKEYEEILFSDRGLSPEQAGDLHEHLKQCDPCFQLSQSWREVEAQLVSPVFADPQPGFVNRWQARLEVEHQKEEKRQNFRMMILTWGTALIISLAIVVISWPVIQAPKAFFYTYLYQLLSLVSFTNSLRSISAGLIEGLPEAVPWILILFAMGVLTQLGVFWVVSYRMLTRPRRVNL